MPQNVYVFSLHCMNVVAHTFAFGQFIPARWSGELNQLSKSLKPQEHSGLSHLDTEFEIKVFLGLEWHGQLSQCSIIADYRFPI